MTNGKFKRFLQNAALFLGVFVLCFVCSEVVLRIAGYGNVEIYEPDPLLYWKLKRNQDCYTKIDRKPVHINSLGTRGRAFDATKPADTVRILCIGDSRTFGWGMSEPETYSGVLEKLLQERIGPKRKAEVINAGVNAYSYSQMLAYLKHVGLKYSPDMVIIGGANLWTQFSENSSPEFVKQFMMRVRLKNFLRRFALYHYIIEVKLNEFYQRHKSKFVPVDPKQDTLFRDQQARDPDAFFRTAIEQMCQTAVSNGVKPVLLYMPTLTHIKTTNNIDNVQRATTLVSQSLNVPLVDVSAAIAPQADALYMDADPVHFNVEGNQIIARQLFETVSNHFTP